MARPPTISLLDRRAADDGIAGAHVGIDDDNTTGRFMGQSFALTERPVQPADDPTTALASLAAQQIGLVLTDLPADDVSKLAAAAAAHGITIFNIQAPDDRLREQDCRGNVIHVAPTRSMLADALAQYLIWKRWTRWLLVYGSHPTDTLLADAYRRSAKRYGARLVQQREFKDIGGSRQTDSGLAETQAQMPVFTQNAPNYDVLVAADENEVFAGYLPYRTWDARPVVGSAGLIPCTWSPAMEAWGGTQMQDRFQRDYHRQMTPLDLQAWTAVRMVGEAASRTQSADPAKIMAYMKGPDFQIAAYKGKPLSLRNWNWQLRQPILLSDGRNVVSVSPQAGFLHQVTDLDTLGVDRPETTCKL
jgi:ABC transporter substrate binding protein (PQQ-dependent alcohol dehydrogenase system)